MSQLSEYLNANQLFSPVQSAYRPNHSTETALVKIVNDLLLSLGDEKVSVLTLLDLSAALDTIDHNILLYRQEHAFGITGTALSWIRLYLSDRDHQTVVVNGLKSEPFRLLYGVSQGSVLGPILFVLYTKPLDDIFDGHSVCHHSFAVDTQMRTSSCLDQLDTTISVKQECVSDVKSWMTLNRLQLNDGKTEAMFVMSKRAYTSGLIPQSMRIGDTDVGFSCLSLHQQVTNTCTAAYIELRRISSICQYLTVDATKTLIPAFVLSRLDYYNALLSGVPQYRLVRLQRVQNAAARLTVKASKSDHITPILHSLH